MILMAGATTSAPSSFATFGELLRYLRRRARLSQRELAIEVGYSEAYISRLEANQRPPDTSTLLALFVPALDLEDQPELAARLLELGTAARGERLPRSVTLVTTSRQTTIEEIGEIEAIPLPPACEVLRPHSLARLRERLSTERGVAICAMAGLGKTTLAAALAREQSVTRPVFWLTLTAGITATVDTLMRQLALFLLAHGQDHVAPVLNRSDSASAPLSLDQQIALVGAALARLADQRGGSRAGRYTGLPLLCFDNVHLVQNDAAVIQVLRHLIAATPATMLLTSREAVPLANITSLQLRGLEREEALELIERLGGSLDQSFAERLLDKTGGSPMLLRLALGQLHEQPTAPADFIAHLEQEPQVASYLLETTLQRLSPAAHSVLTLLSIFRHPINLYDDSLLELLGSASDGAPDMAAGVAELQRRYLIERPAQAALHRLVRDHGYAALSTELRRKRELHRVAATWYEAVSDTVEAAYHYAHANELALAVDALDDQIDPVIARGQALSAADVVDELLALVRRRRGDNADLLRRLLSIRGALLVNTLRAAEAEASYREAFELAHTAAVRARLAAALSTCLLQRGQAAEALELARDATAALAPADVLLRAQLAIVESNANFMLTRYAATEQFANSALASLALLREAPAHLLAAHQAQAHNLLGLALKMRGKAQLAFDHWEHAVAYARSAGLRQIENRFLMNLGNLAYEQGDLAGAQHLYEQALVGAEAVADSYTIGRVCTNLGNLHLVRGDPAAALQQLDQALLIKQSTGDRRGLVATNIQRARALLALGHSDEAHMAAENVQAQAMQSGEVRLQAHALLLLGQLQLYEGQSAEARDAISAALGLPGVTADISLRDDLTNYLALALIACGDQHQAAEYLASDPQAGGSLEVAMERMLIGGVLALARGDRAAVAATVVAVSEQASSTGYLVYRPLAQRLGAADSTRAPTALPRLLLGPDSV